MNELQVFNNPEFGELRTVMRDGVPWFVAIDVCKALELEDTGKAIGRLDRDEGARIEIAHPQSIEKTLEVWAVNEPGLYSLVLGSRKPEARAFKRWITHEVIPSIRKHGAYLTPEKVEEVLLNPDTIISLATQLKEERAARQRLSAKVEADAPKVMFAESVSASKGSILIKELATYLTQNGVKIGQNRLFERLREDGFLCSSRGERWNMPTQKAMEMKLFELKKNQIMTPDGPMDVKPTIKVTGKGQIYFLNRYLHVAV